MSAILNNSLHDMVNTTVESMRAKLHAAHRGEVCLMCHAPFIKAYGTNTSCKNCMPAFIRTSGAGCIGEGVLARDCT